jgi:hypothetical protein
MPVPADAGHDGAGRDVLTPIKQRTDGPPLHADQHTYNKLPRELRCLGERGFALLLERWKVLRHVTMSPRRITDLARAALKVRECLIPRQRHNDLSDCSSEQPGLHVVEAA